MLEGGGDGGVGVLQQPPSPSWDERGCSKNK